MSVLPTLPRHLLVSILVFSGTENILRLLGSISELLDSLGSDEGLTTTVVVRNNNPMLDMGEVENCIAGLAGRGVEYLLFEGPNLGFGPGHNQNFRARPSEFFLILNDDIGFRDLDWLRIGIRKFQSDETLALLGDHGNPKFLSPFFGNGGADAGDKHYPLRYAEASVLLARSSVFERIGMFDETIEWAMSEDADLSLKVQSLGYRIDFIDIPHQHWRSTSFNRLPSYAKVTIQEHNRARLFAKWGNALSSGQVGEVEILDVCSLGIGDVFCALVHIDAYLRSLTLDLRQRTIINTNHPSLAKLLLPIGTRIESEADEQALFARFRISGFRSTRPINYALPFNIHSLVCGKLSVPMATPEQAKETVARAVAPVLASKAPSDGPTCVVHVEFGRDGHDGRGPSKVLKAQLIEEACRQFEKVVIVGSSATVDADEISEWGEKIEDLRGHLDLMQLMATISQADFFIGIDSFPAHVAQIAGTRSAVLFGSVHPAMRAWNERQTWPIAADLECIGCYHEQIEPGIPFCMRRDTACMAEMPTGRIAAILHDMKLGVPFDWTSLRKTSEKRQAKFIHLLSHHPAPPRHFLRPRSRNEEVSNLIYDLTEKIAVQTGRHAQSQIVANLKADNDLLKDRVRGAETALLERHPSYASVPMGEIFAHRHECSLTHQEGHFVVQAHTHDPQIYFVPIKLPGGLFRLTISAMSNSPARMQIFFRGPHEDWDEQRSVGVDIGQTKKHLSFVRVASAPRLSFCGWTLLTGYAKLFFPESCSERLRSGARRGSPYSTFKKRGNGFQS